MEKANTIGNKNQMELTAGMARGTNEVLLTLINELISTSVKV